RYFYFLDRRATSLLGLLLQHWVSQLARGDRDLHQLLGGRRPPGPLRDDPGGLPPKTLRHDIFARENPPLAERAPGARCEDGDEDRVDIPLEEISAPLNQFQRSGRKPAQSQQEKEGARQTQIAEQFEITVMHVPANFFIAAERKRHQVRHRKAVAFHFLI